MDKQQLLQLRQQIRTEEVSAPSFSIRNQSYQWITAGEKTIEIRKGKQRKGERIIFLSGRRACLKGVVSKKHEGKLEEVLNLETYKRIVPTAETLDDALAFVKGIYPQAEGLFTTYEFKIK